MRNAPTFSIITACLNSERYIQQTIESVAAQVDVTCEHIIVDGGSSDRTLEIVRDSLPASGRCISGPDSGIAEAMNKGIALATGEWLLFLQSDDYLFNSETLKSAFKHFHSDVDICGFPVLFGSGGALRLVHPRGAGPWLNFKTGFNHQGTFIRRSLFDRLGGYDTSFKIAMDYELFLRVLRSGGLFEWHAAPVISVMRDSGISSQLDWPNLSRRLREEKRAHEMHQTAALWLPYKLWWSLYPSYRRVRSGRNPSET